MPGFDGSGPRGCRLGRGYGPCGSRSELNSLNSENKMSFLEEKIEKLEKENKLLSKTIKELKSK